MKKIVPLLILLTFLSCEFTPIKFKPTNSKYKPTEFLLINSYDTTIEIHTSALVRQTNIYKEEGYIEKSLYDRVAPNDTLSLRKINVSKDFKIKSIFTKIKVFKGKEKINFDLFDKNNWVQTLNTERKNKFFITINPEYFE